MSLKNAELFYESQGCDIYFLPDVNAIYYQWKQNCWGDLFREALLNGLDLTREKKLTKWIADTRDFGSVSEEDIEWLQNEYTSENAKAGMKFLAFVVDKNDFDTMTVADGAMEANEFGMTTAYFENMEKAFNWLNFQ